MTEEPLREEARVADVPVDPRTAPVRIPASFWIWLIILIASYAIPNLLAMQGRGAKVVQESGITAGGLQRLQGAEMQVRLSLAGDEFRKASGKQGKDLTDSAVDTYRDLAVEKKGVVSARKVLVLEHLLKKPFDDAFLTGVLAKNLAASKVDAGSIASELALWRSLYSKDASELFDKEYVDDTISRIKRLRLGSLERLVVADAYSLAGQKASADKERKAVQQDAMSYVVRLSLGGIVMIMAALTGFAALILALVAAVKRKWGWIGRVEIPEVPHQMDKPVTPSFGSLLDIFVAYLAISRGVGLLAGALPGLESIPNVTLTAGVYVGTAALAAFYLWYRARIEGWKLADIGLHSPGKLSLDVMYGLVGYCAALPLVGIAGLINSKFIKGEDSTLAPNPVLPMIAGEGSEIGRFVLFCLVAVAAPIFEELFFRGVLYSALKTRFNTAACIIISGACFAIVHPMGDWLPIFALGCALASVRELRQSLVPGMVMHFCQNSMAFIAMRMLF